MTHTLTRYSKRAEEAWPDRRWEGKKGDITLGFESLQFEGAPVQLFHDLPSETLKQHTLQKANIRYRWSFPSTIIVIYDGKFKCLNKRGSLRV
uniref:Uncharacterized protein n=1 Tax=Salvator merianae TaxID=96440 RepID=A0A8D0DSM9_SALMN